MFLFFLLEIFHSTFFFSWLLVQILSWSENSSFLLWIQKIINYSPIQIFRWEESFWAWESVIYLQQPWSAIIWRDSFQKNVEGKCGSIYLTMNRLRDEPSSWEEVESFQVVNFFPVNSLFFNTSWQINHKIKINQDAVYLKRKCTQVLHRYRGLHFLFLFFQELKQNKTK